jgi:hypothetical protein
MPNVMHYKVIRIYQDKEYGMVLKDMSEKYDEFSKAVQNNNILETKTTTMLYLAASIAVGCYP